MDPHPLSSVSLWICRQSLHLPSHILPPQWIYTSLLNLLIYATLSKPIIFVTLPGASFSPLWLWDWVETAQIQCPASYLCHVQSRKVEDWLYFLSWIPFAAWIPPTSSSWKVMLCAEAEKHTRVWVQTRTPVLYDFCIFFDFYFTYYIDWYKFLA